MPPRGLAPERLEEIGRRHRLRLLYLFGSRAKGTAATGSDWDFAVLFEEDPDDRVFARMALVERDLSLLVSEPVEVTTLHGAGAVFRFEVVSTGICLFADDRLERVRFEARACRDFEDDAHRRRIYADGNRRFFSRGRQ
jgi:predicted nucleotidyltransferase